ncbi:ATP-binding protein [Pseudoalteromonas sp. T1lg65]|uniref:ATP-binding protein n=1 Tax=Pseudoalteromonas sp. T1lg65 TaxID=2077101 RepID=UPI003F7A696F
MRFKNNMLKIISISVFSLALLGLFVWLLWSVDQRLQEDVTEQLLSEMATEANTIEDEFLEYYAEHIQVLNVVYDTPPIQGIGRALSNQGIDPVEQQAQQLWEQRLARIFQSFIFNMDSIVQLRMITADGQELVRVDRKNGKVFSVPKAKLQNKSDRAYVSETLKLSEFSAYISKVELNIENGKIEQPINPVLRVAIPVYSAENELFAILVVNASAKPLFSTLEQRTFKHYLLDAEGFYVYGASSKYQFTQELGSPMTIASEYQQQPMQINNGIWLLGKQAQPNQLALIKQFNPSRAYTGIMQLLSKVDINSYYAELSERRRATYMLGGLITIVMLAVIIAVLVFYRTKQRDAEDRLVFESIIKSSKEPIVSFDLSLEVKTFNQASIAFFPSLLDANNRAYQCQSLPMVKLKQALGELLTKGKLERFNWQEETQVNNERVVMRLDVDPIIDSNGDPIGITLFGSDITEQNAAEELIKRANTELEQKVAERTRALQAEKQKAEQASQLKSDFISTVSHEMRTPLNGILGTLNLLHREPQTDKALNYIEMAETSSTTLAALINDLLDLSKIEAGKLEIDSEPFHPISLIEHVLYSISFKAFDKQLEVSTDLSAVDFTRLQGDAGRIKQIIFNLVNNAIKFTNNGGVYVSARTRVVAEQVLFEVSVTDTGIGIDKANQHKLFDSFTQENVAISSEFGGTGLGLAICKKLCELMGGQISFESEKGKGSTFNFSLPFSLELAEVISNKRLLEQTKISVSLENQFTALHLYNTLVEYGAEVTDENADWIICDASEDTYLQLQNSDNYSKTIVLHSDFNGETVKAGCKACLAKPLRLAAMLSVFNPQARDVLKMNKVRQISDALPLEQFDLSGVRCLIVDDNKINQEVARGLLESVGGDAICCSSGHEALETLSKLELEGINISVVLMDCNMPGMDGYDTTRLIRSGNGTERFKSVPIFAMTASAMSGEREKCLAAGMDDYLTKPLEPMTMLTMIANVAGKRPSLVNPTPHNPQPTSSNEQDVDAMPIVNMDEVMHRLQGDAELYNKLCALFFEQSQAKLDALRQHIAQVEHEQIRQSSHALRGQTGDIGACQLHALFAELEIQAKDQNQRMYAPLMDAIHAAYQRFSDNCQAKSA